MPIVDRRPPQTGGEGDRRHVQQQVRRAAEGRVHDHCVAHRGIGEDVAQLDAAGTEVPQCRGTAAGHVEPDRLPRRGKRRVRQREPQGLGNDLRRGGRSQELAAAAGECAGPARQHRRFFERKLLVRKAGTDRLHLAGIFAFGRRQASRRPARARTAVRRMPASASIMAGNPLSHVATPNTPCRVGSERIKRRKIVAASLR